MADVRLKPRDSDSRCPFCHEEVARGGLCCSKCDALHHKVCLLENKQTRCASCGQELEREVADALPATRAEHAAARRRRARAQWVAIGGVGLGLLLLLLAGGAALRRGAEADPEQLRVRLREASQREQVLELGRLLAAADPTDPQPGIRSYMWTGDPAYLLQALEANRSWTIQDPFVIKKVRREAPAGLADTRQAVRWARVVEAFGDSPDHTVGAEMLLLLAEHCLEVGDHARARAVIEAANTHAKATLNETLWGQVEALRRRLEGR